MALDTEAPPGSSLVVSAVGLAVVSVGGSRLSHIKGAILRGTQSSVSDNIHEIGILSQLGSTKLCWSEACMHVRHQVLNTKLPANNRLVMAHGSKKHLDSVADKWGNMVVGDLPVPDRWFQLPFYFQHGCKPIPDAITWRRLHMYAHCPTNTWNFNC
jgi:hypothetical protein